ncbi:MAG: glycosyltransferase [Gammaproteobacteria bacterium]|nr:glycosyltransferase [Gammaproteobacteria bacterium]MBU1776208.1 glycosyltransferase [Gammaproteobacteria bacterium]
MKKLLTICIPTYKRPDTLRRCVDSITSQIEKFGLSNCVEIYVTNDASPDHTADVMRSYESYRYFKGVTREQNLGMNLNIRHTLGEVAMKSEYQLIVTDDDYLQPDMLNCVTDFLRQQLGDIRRAPAIWTPRYSYTEDGQLYCISCSPFEKNVQISPSIPNSGRYMVNGFVLSGLIVCSALIDFEFWEEYKENAYFPMIFFGDLIHRKGAVYWHKNIVHHTVLNKCHWESWGRSDLLIEIRKISDYLNAYGVMGSRMEGFLDKAKFYVAAFPGIVRATTNFMHSDLLSGERTEVFGAVDEQKAKGIFKLMPALRRLMPFALLVGVMFVLAKLVVVSLLCLIGLPRAQIAHHRKRLVAYLAMLKNLPVMSRLIF